MAIDRQNNLKGKIAIVGIEETKIGRHPGKNPDQLAAEASIEAIEDAGLTKHDIDGVLIPGTFQGEYSSQSAHSAIFAEYIGMSFQLDSDIFDQFLHL